MGQAVLGSRALDRGLKAQSTGRARLSPAALSGGRGVGQTHALAVLDHLAECCGIPFTRDDVVCEDRGQHGFVFRLQQRIDGASGKCIKCGIGRRKDGKWTGALERIDEASSFDRRDQRSVILGIDCVVYDVLGGQHGGSTHHHISHCCDGYSRHRDS